MELQGASVFFNELVEEGIGVMGNVYRVYRQNLPSSEEKEKKIVRFDTLGKRNAKLYVVYYEEKLRDSREKLREYVR
jgi:hypothetical protein